MLSFVRYCPVLLVFSCVLTSVSLAGPQDYCALFAKDAANRKTGQSAVITGAIDNLSSGSKANSAPTRTLPEIETWQRAYEQSFTACMEDYGVSNAVAPTKTAKATSRAKVTQHRPARSGSSKRTHESLSKAKAKTK